MIEANHNALRKRFKLTEDLRQLKRIKPVLPTTTREAFFILPFMKNGGKQQK